MIEHIVAASRCLRMIADQSSNEWLVFHFKGVFCGSSISEIYVEAIGDLSFVEIGKEYILYLRVIGVKNSILYTRHIRSKAIDDIYWN